MIVTCEHCAARYKLDPGRISGRGVRITCPRCKNVFVVYSSQAEDGGLIETEEASAAVEAAATGRGATGAPAARAAAGPATAAAPKPASATARPAPAAPAAAAAAAAAPAKAAEVRPDVESLDFATVGIQAWKVKVRIGLVYDFSDYKTLARYIKDGRVGNDDQISHDGATWTRLGDIPDLQQHFVQVFLDARRVQEAAAAPTTGFDDDGPTMIVGAADVASSLARGAAAAGGSTGGGARNLRAAKGPEMDALQAAVAEAADAEDADDADDDDDVVIGAGNGGPSGPRFNDPFAASRSRSGGSARSNTTRRASSAAAGPAPARRGSLGMVVVVGALLGGGGVAVWYGMNHQGTNVDIEAQQRQAEHNALMEKQSRQAQEKMRDNVNSQIYGALQPTAADDDAFASPEDDAKDQKLIPVVPQGRGGVRSAPVGTEGASTSGAAGAPVADMGAAVVDTPTTPKDHYDAGRSAYQSGDYSNAVRGFQQAADGDPGNGNYHYWLGNALLKTGATSDAQRELRQASSLGVSRALDVLGDIAAQQGDVAGAMDDYQQYLRTNPSDAAAVQAKMDRLQSSP